METNAAFDFAAVFAPILLMLAMCLTVFYRLRARWPVKVNCWFCNGNTKIWRQDLAWWLCPWCEQYNGFSKDDNYAYDIPEQYAAPKAHKRYCRPSEGKDSRQVFEDKLCAYCNERESQKLLELSSFEPKSEKLFDTELKAFKECLEARYPLCDGCKSTARDVLRRQAAWLTRYKMLCFRRKPIEMFSNARQRETLFRLISTILIALAIHDFIWLPISGLLFRLCTFWASFKTRNRSTEVLWVFLLFCFAITVFVKSLTTKYAWLTMELVMQYRLMMVCVFAADLFIYLIRLLNSSVDKSALNGSVAFKKIKLHSQDTISSQFACSSQTSNVRSETNDSIKPSVYTAGELFSTEIKFSKSHSAILRQKLSTITANNGNNGYLSSVSQRENGTLDNCCLNDSLSTLLLSEDSLRRGRSAKAAPAIFERKVYSTTSSENLFRRAGSAYGKRRCILSPPKLRSVTQTSWVAGGYWQEGMMTSATPPTLSRSSSQSSGFGSVGSSNLAPSREPSVHEFDRCSVVSEATRWSCQTPRPGPVARHDSPVPRPRSRYSDAVGNHSPPAIGATRHVDDHVQESYARGPNVRDRNGWVPPVPAGPHTTTIIASPGWLSAMLCGSLILNMIVLCATLLR